MTFATDAYLGLRDACEVGKICVASGEYRAGALQGGAEVHVHHLGELDVGRRPSAVIGFVGG